MHTDWPDLPDLPLFLNKHVYHASCNYMYVNHTLTYYTFILLSQLLTSHTLTLLQVHNQTKGYELLRPLRMAYTTIEYPAHNLTTNWTLSQWLQQHTRFQQTAKRYTIDEVTRRPATRSTSWYPQCASTASQHHNECSEWLVRLESSSNCVHTGNAMHYIPAPCTLGALLPARRLSHSKRQ